MEMTRKKKKIFVHHVRFSTKTCHDKRGSRKKIFDVGPMDGIGKGS